MPSSGQRDAQLTSVAGDGEALGNLPSAPALEVDRIAIDDVQPRTIDLRQPCTALGQHIACQRGEPQRDD